MSILVLSDNNRNSFVDYEYASGYITSNVIGGEAFATLTQNECEKYLVKAYFDIVYFPFNQGISYFDALPVNVKNAFKNAQCEQAYAIFSPETYSGIMRRNGISSITLEGEQMEIEQNEKFRLCDGARKFLESYIDFSIGVA